jgi:4-carboxymuconolactone decarboxylase
MTPGTRSDSGRPQHDLASPDNQARLAHGLQVLGRIDGQAGRAVIDALAGIAPALGHHIAAFAFGDVYDRPGLDPRSRQLVTIGALTALGGCEAQLRVHVGAALTVGLTPDEIVEAVLHTSVYCGFPRALNAIFVVKDVFAERGVSPTPAADR